MFYDTLRAALRFPGTYHMNKAYYRRAFFHPRHDRSPRFWGVYDSFEAAQAEAARCFGKADYDEPSIVNNSVESFMSIQLFDWPVIYHVDRAIRDSGARSLVDFGGHIGVKYYAYRSSLHLPSDFQWTVVDVASMIEEGRRRRDELGGGGVLQFAERAIDAGTTDALLCSGSLQYAPQELDTLLEDLGHPRDVILSKIPTSCSGRFYTLDNLGGARVPYRIYARNEIGDLLTRLGYREVSSWTIPDRGFSIPFTSAQVTMTGLAWSR